MLPTSTHAARPFEPPFAVDVDRRPGAVGVEVTGARPDVGQLAESVLAVLGVADHQRVEAGAGHHDERLAVHHRRRRSVVARPVQGDVERAVQVDRDVEGVGEQVGGARGQDGQLDGGVLGDDRVDAAAHGAVATPHEQSIDPLVEQARGPAWAPSCSRRPGATADRRPASASPPQLPQPVTQRLRLVGEHADRGRASRVRAPGSDVTVVTAFRRTRTQVASSARARALLVDCEQPVAHSRPKVGGIDPPGVDHDPMAAEELLASWNDTPTRQAIVDYVGARDRRRARPRRRPRTASPRSTTTARCGARSRCRSSWPSSSSGSPTMADAPTSRCGSKQPWKAAYERDVRMAERRRSPSTTPVTTPT